MIATFDSLTRRNCEVQLSGAEGALVAERVWPPLPKPMTRTAVRKMRTRNVPMSLGHGSRLERLRLAATANPAMPFSAGFARRSAARCAGLPRPGHAPRALTVSGAEHVDRPHPRACPPAPGFDTPMSRTGRIIVRTASSASAAHD